MTTTDRSDRPDLSELASFLDNEGADGYLLDAASESSDQRYLSGFDAPDPFVSLFVPNGMDESESAADEADADAEGSNDGGSVFLLVSGLEYGRARTESHAAAVSRLADFDYREKREAHGQEEANHRVLAEFLATQDVASVAVPPRFPVGTADGLRDLDVAVTPEYDGVLTEARARKTPAEIESIRVAQRANEKAMAAAENLLGEATIGGDDLLYRGEGDEPLTAEAVKTTIETTLLEEGHALDETIVACGADAADPHNRGSGPLEANEPLIIDVFPRGKASNYHADMTRTFCVGEPTEEIERRYDITEEALAAALDAVSPDTTGEAVHDAVCDVYEEAGYATLRSDERTETGFIHSTGHGVGLDVHELPRLSAGGGDLEAGQVITIEPGLYDPAIGGVRIEDLVVVTEEGYENLTEYPKSLVVG
jgi:Xaa-Pro aminopeptidase